MIDIPISCVEKLHRHQIYPIVLLIKFKSTKHIKEIKDTRFSLDKLSGKAAKEMYEHCQKLEAEYRHLITGKLTYRSFRHKNRIEMFCCSCYTSRRECYLYEYTSFDSRRFRAQQKSMGASLKEKV